MITGQMQAIAINPAMITTLRPSGIRVQIAQFVRYPSHFSITLMADTSLGLEQALVCIKMIAFQILSQRLTALSQKLVEILKHSIQLFVASRQRAAVGRLLHTSILNISGCVLSQCPWHLK